MIILNAVIYIMAQSFKKWLSTWPASLLNLFQHKNVEMAEIIANLCSSNSKTQRSSYYSCTYARPLLWIQFSNKICTIISYCKFCVSYVPGHLSLLKFAFHIHRSLSACIGIWGKNGKVCEVYILNSLPL